MNLEKELGSALRRTGAPETLRQGVMERIAAAERTRGRAVLTRSAAVILAVGLFAVGGLRVSHDLAERREGEAAKQELLLAMKITAQKTAVVRDAVQH